MSIILLCISILVILKFGGLVWSRGASFGLFFSHLPYNLLSRPQRSCTNDMQLLFLIFFLLVTKEAKVDGV